MLTERKLPVKDVRFIDEIHLRHLIKENEVQESLAEKTDYIGQVINRLEKQWF